MIKNKIILTLIICSLLSPLFVVKASTELTNEQNIKQGSIEIRTMILNKKIDERKNEKKTVLNTKSKDAIFPILTKIYKNLDEKVKKMEAIDSEISARMAELKKEGKDTTVTEAQYNIAKLELDKAQASVIVASTLSVKQILSSTSQGVIRDLVKETENSIKNAGNSYKKMIPLFIQLEAK